MTSEAALKSFLHLASHFDKNSFCFPCYLIQTFLYIFLPSICLTCSVSSSLVKLSLFFPCSYQLLFTSSLPPAADIQTRRETTENLKIPAQLSKRRRGVTLAIFLTQIRRALSCDCCCLYLQIQITMTRLQQCNFSHPSNLLQNT